MKLSDGVIMQNNFSILSRKEIDYRWDTSSHNHIYFSAFDDDSKWNL